jgi:NAD+--dinitrogen-reductase ADP-D-ribosyltransferase
LPPWVIASRHFNENPQPLEIQGVRASNRFFFDKLETLAESFDRAALFLDYMSVKFQLHHWQDQATELARNSIKNNYLHFLKCWMIDSNSISGAVLKRWVESRMGIHPTYHKACIKEMNSEAYFNYSVDVMKGSACTSAIQSQLDILFSYCQFELARKFPNVSAITLFRGTHDAEEYDVIEQLATREQIVRMNNLVSFTSEVERAWEFGRTVWKTAVPLAKIFFYSGLLPGSIMKGEEEFMIIGGDYRVERVRY